MCDVLDVLHLKLVRFCGQYRVVWEECCGGLRKPVCISQGVFVFHGVYVCF